MLQEDREKLWYDLYKVVVSLKDTMDAKLDNDDYTFDNVLAGMAEINNLDVPIRYWFDDGKPLLVERS